MLENFIYAKEKSLFEEALNNGKVLDEAIVFIEDTKEIWNHGTYFDGSTFDSSDIETSILNILDTKADKEEVYSKKEIDIILSVSKYEFVDLGLPSGLKWATCNVGAEKPEEYGLYFAWGETEGYTGITDTKKFSWADYKWCNGSDTTLTKYNNNSSYGTVDTLTTLEQVDDAAYTSDKTCRMPTKEELKELTANTTSTWETLNGVNGRRFTSKTNGNSIFVPAAGGCYYGSVYFVGSYGGLWGSSLDESGSEYAWYLYFRSDDVYVGSDYRYDGLSVRAVQEATTNSLFDPTNYYTKEEIDALLGDINTALDYIINGPKLITFTIESVEYQAEEGMTWLDWVNSEYNTIMLSISDTKITNGSKYISLTTAVNNEFVDKNETIESVNYYLTAAIPE